MEGKHPVSMLQELMAQQHKELPMYEIVDILRNGSHQFECTVRVEDSAFIAIATSKQCAKKLAAAKALDSYGCLNIYKRQLENTEVKNTDSSIRANYNSVGQLNELTAKRRLPYPTYIECGISKNFCNIFEVKCSVLDYTTVGSSSTKKHAKQMAAYHMLNKLKEEKVINFSVVLPSQPCEEVDTSDNDVIEKYKELSLLSPRISKSVEISDNNEVKINNEIDVKNERCTGNNLNSKESPPKTLEQMYDELASLNIGYTIDIVNRNPFILVLKFENESNTTVLESGDIYEEVQKALIQNALKVIQVC